MKKPLLIHRYLFKEMITPFFLSLAVATFILLLAKIVELTDMVVTRGVGMGVVARLLLYAMPYFFVFTVPMATLLGVLLGFLRLSSDNEIIALRAAGVSLRSLLPPVAALALFAWMLTQGLSLWVLPWGHNQFENVVFEVAHSRADLALRERVFLDSFGKMTMYVNRLPGERLMQDIFIVDERDPEKVNTVVAKRGRLFPGKDGHVILRLYEGTMHGVDTSLRSARNASFDTYDIQLETGVMNNAQRQGKHRKEMYLGELLAEMDKNATDERKYTLLDMEFQQRFAYPFSCLVMALIALPLGTHWQGGRSWGVIAALAVFLVYYLMLSLAWSLGDTGFYPPKIGVWMPNIAFGILGFFMFKAEVSEKPLPILDALGNLPSLIMAKRHKNLEE
jgi:lipopolysaccharide export system permease protein